MRPADVDAVISGLFHGCSSLSGDTADLTLLPANESLPFSLVNCLCLTEQEARWRRLARPPEQPPGGY
jgi:hypothetical protein